MQTRAHIRSVKNNSNKTIKNIINTNYSNNNCKRSKNFDEWPHRPLVTPRGGEWIRPTLNLFNKINICFLGPTQSAAPHMASRQIQPFEHALQQRLPVFFNGADNPPKCPSPSNTWLRVRHKRHLNHLDQFRRFFRAHDGDQ